MDQPDRLYYLTAPPALRPLGAICTTVGSATTHPGDRYPPHPLAHPHTYRSVSADGRVLNEWQFVFIEQGHGWLAVGSAARTPISRNQLLIVRPGVWHQYAPRSETGWSEHWVGFTGVTFEQALAAVGLADGPAVVSCRDPAQLAMAYEELCTRAAQNDTAGHVVMVAAVMRMIGVLGTWVKRETGAGYSDELGAAVSAMAERPDGSLSVAALSEVVGLSESALRRRFARETGMSPYHFYNTLRINRVKLELAHSKAALASIAEEYGFTDAFHLSRVFKQYTGLAPSEWRLRGG